MTQHSGFSDSAQSLMAYRQWHAVTVWLFLCRVCRSRRAEWRCSETSQQSVTQMCLDLTNMRINLSLISLPSSRHSDASLVWCLCHAHTRPRKQKQIRNPVPSLRRQEIRVLQKKPRWEQQRFSDPPPQLRKTSFSWTWHLREQRKSTNRNYWLFQVKKWFSLQQQQLHWL